MLFYSCKQVDQLKTDISKIQSSLNNATDEEEVRERQRAHEIAMQKADQQKILLQKEADEAKKSLLEVEIKKQSCDAAEREKERQFEAAEKEKQRQHEAAEKEKQRQHEAAEKEKQRQHEAAEKEKQRMHEKEVEKLRNKNLLLEIQLEESKREEAKKIREFELQKAEIEKHYNSEIEKQRNQLKHEASMQDQILEQKRLENKKLSLEIEKLKYQDAPKRRRNDRLNSNEMFHSLPANACAAGADDSFNGE